MNTWIIVADASRARILCESSDLEDLREVEALVHPASRLQTSELVADGAGRLSKGPGQARAMMEARTPAHELEAIRFGKTLADRLNRGLAGGKYAALTLVAPAHFLGILRQALSDRVADTVVNAVAKDYSRLTGEKLKDALLASGVLKSQVL